MIKFFRKVRQKLIGEGDVRKNLVYVIGEILLVVIGILIALQINNWNQQRLETKEERLLLKEIHTEFTFNKAEIEETRRMYTLARDRVGKVISIFPISSQNIDLDSLAIYLEGITFNPSFDVSRGSIENLKYASSFEIISEDELRTWLLRFDDIFEDYADRESRSKHFSIDYLDAFLRLHVPSPAHKGIRDMRIDLSFLSTVEFQNLIKERVVKVQNFMQILDNPDRPLVQAINRIVELSEVEEVD